MPRDVDLESCQSPANDASRKKTLFAVLDDVANRALLAMRCCEPDIIASRVTQTLVHRFGQGVDRPSYVSATSTGQVQAFHKSNFSDTLDPQGSSDDHQRKVFPTA